MKQKNTRLFDDEFKCAIVWGEQGYGMSMYHLRLAEEYYRKKYPKV